MKNWTSLLLLGHKFQQVGKLLAPTRGLLHVPMGLGLALPCHPPGIPRGLVFLIKEQRVRGRTHETSAAEHGYLMPGGTMVRFVDGHGSQRRTRSRGKVTGESG